MTNMILYEFAKNKEYTLKNLVNDYEKNLQDVFQKVMEHLPECILSSQEIRIDT